MLFCSLRASATNEPEDPDYIGVINLVPDAWLRGKNESSSLTLSTNISFQYIFGNDSACSVLSEEFPLLQFYGISLVISFKK